MSARSSFAAALSPFLVAWASGCGLDAGAGLDPFPSDGVSGFGKPSFVHVCIGPARVVPTGETAVCVPDGASFSACSSDIECGGAERCLCGRCIVRACDATTVCPAGEACRGGRCTLACIEDTDCAQGERCNGGGCARSCDADQDCFSGEVCDFFGDCAAEPCSGATSCGSGYTCEGITVFGEVREPVVASVEGERVAFFELRTGAGAAIHRGRFTDPLHIVADPMAPVLSAAMNGASVGAPSVLVTGDDVLLLFAEDGGSAIGLATSSDGGRSFSVMNDALLTPAAGWENGRVSAPGVFETAGETFFFYEGGDGAGIGLARLSNSSASRVFDAPVARPSDLEDSVYWRSVETIRSPYALVSGDIVRLYVSARGIDGQEATTPTGPVPPEANDSIGMLATTDRMAFERYPNGPVLSALSGLFGALGEREPAVIVGESGAEVYFVATDASGTKVSGLSRASSVR